MMCMYFNVFLRILIFTILFVNNEMLFITSNETSSSRFYPTLSSKNQLFYFQIEFQFFTFESICRDLLYYAFTDKYFTVLSIFIFLLISPQHLFEIKKHWFNFAHSIVFLKIVHSIQAYSTDKPTIVTIGTFDGVHLGHKKS